MQATAMQPTEVAETLRRVIRATAGAESAFERVATRSRTDTLVRLFRERARSCAVALDDLRFALRGVASDDGMASDAGRWQAPSEADESPLDDRAALAVAERAENEALAAYLEALAQPLPEDVKKIVRSHLDGVQHDRDRLRALIDAADGATTQARVTRS